MLCETASRKAAATLLAAVMVAGLVGGCSRGQPPPPDVLGGAPRYPSEEGVVESVTAEAITLDGGRSFPLADRLASFSTYTLKPIPLLHRVGQYVHLGIEDDEVTWVATIGAVAQLEQRVVVYTGELLQVDDERRAIFRDGTVLRLGDGVDPRVGAVRVEIDPATRLATSVTPNNE